MTLTLLNKYLTLGGCNNVSVINCLRKRYTLCIKQPVLRQTKPHTKVQYYHPRRVSIVLTSALFRRIQWFASSFGLAGYYLYHYHPRGVFINRSPFRAYLSNLLFRLFGNLLKISWGSATDNTRDANNCGICFIFLLRNIFESPSAPFSSNNFISITCTRTSVP